MIIQFIHFLITKNKIARHFLRTMKFCSKSVKNKSGILEYLSASKKRKCSNIAITENIFTFTHLKNA